MKKKLFTLLTLLLCVCSGAWAADAVSATQTLSNGNATCTWAITAATVGKNVTEFGADGLLFTTGNSNGISIGDSGANLKLNSYGNIIYVEVPSATSEGSITLKAPGNQAHRNVQLNSGTLLPMSTSGTTKNFVSTDIVTIGGKYYIKLVNTNDGGSGASADYKIVVSNGISVTLTNGTYTTSAPTISLDKTSAIVRATASGTAATTTINLTGENLTNSGTLTASISPVVDGLTVTPSSIDIAADGSISSTDLTVSFTATSNVASGTATLTLSDGTTSKDIKIYYSAVITPWTLQSISESTTWTFNDSNIPTTNNASLGDSNEHVYANISGLTFASSFDATALAITGSYPYYSAGSQHIAQGNHWKFNTTVRGKVTVSYSTADSGGSTRYIKIGGIAAGSTGSTPVTTDAIAVGNGSAINVEINSYSDEKCKNPAYINVTQIVFTATPYSVTYDANGADEGTVPTAVAYYADGETVTVLDNTGSLAKEGKVFGGWNTAADGSGTSYAAAATFNISANVTLYARWVEPVIVTMPTNSRTGYNCTASTGSITDNAWTMKKDNISSSPYILAAGTSATLTIPASTNISKITLIGTSSESSASSISITGVTGDTSGSVALNDRKGALVSIDFVPETQTTTYTIANTHASKGAYFVISIYGTENVAKIGETKWGTFSSTSATSFPVDGISAYKVASIGVDKVIVEPVTDDVPANTGLLLYGNAGEYTIPVADNDGSSVGDNLMTAGTGANVTSGYVLSGLHGDFRPVPTSGVVVPYGKAYLSIPNGTRSLSIAFDDETTGINSVESENNGLLNGDFYNVAGQRVAKPTKGLYIVNGKKVIIK